MCELTVLLSQTTDPDVVYSILRDLMTVDELLAIEQRRDIAKRIHSWETYIHIASQTGASSTTIARVAKYLNWDHGGYIHLLEYISEK